MNRVRICSYWARKSQQRRVMWPLREGREIWGVDGAFASMSWRRDCVRDGVAPSANELATNNRRQTTNNKQQTSLGNQEEEWPWQKEVSPLSYTDPPLKYPLPPVIIQSQQVSPIEHSWLEFLSCDEEEKKREKEIEGKQTKPHPTHSYTQLQNTLNKSLDVTLYQGMWVSLICIPLISFKGQSLRENKTDLLLFIFKPDISENVSIQFITLSTSSLFLTKIVVWSANWLSLIFLSNTEIPWKLAF